MAFLIDRGIAAESEEEFDAEGDRYEELKTRLLGGQTMKYEEMEELLAAAKFKNDRKVIDVLKNVVDDSATDAVTESEKEPTKSELLDKLIRMCKSGSGLRIALEEIKDKFALDESKEDEDDGEDRDVIDKLLDKISALVKKLKPGKLRDKLEDAIDLFTVDESNAYGQDVDKLVTSNVS